MKPSPLVFLLTLWALLGTGCTGSDTSQQQLPEFVPDTLGSFSFPDAHGQELSWDMEGGVLMAAGRKTTPAAIYLHVLQPDCPACREQAQALEQFVQAQSPEDVAVIGIAHRGDSDAVRSFVAETGVSYPVGIATGSEWAQLWSRGDPFYIIAGRTGRVLYWQSGFRSEDTGYWEQALAHLQAGEDLPFRALHRDELSTGDPLPDIEFPELFSGTRISLKSREGQLEFQNVEGVIERPLASVGFFSRY